jgi:type I restriction enzyme M protein
VTSEGDYLSLTDVANGAEVGLSAVSNWRTRYSDFPRPHVVSGQEVFARDEIAEWLRNRKIPRNRLKPDERPGVSYGERLLLSVATTRRPATEVPESEPARRQQGVPWSKALWSAMDQLRGAHDRSFALEYLLGLVYVRIYESEVWQALAGTTDWSEVRATLSAVSLPTTGGAAIPVFRALSQFADASLLGAIQLVDKIDLDGDPGPASPAAQISDAILADLERTMGRSGGHFTPPDVARLLVEVLEPGEPDQVYDPFCSSGELLIAAAAAVARENTALDDRRVHGQTPHDLSLVTSKMNLRMHGLDADVRGPVSALEADLFRDQRFSVILTNPPFGARLDSTGPRDWPFGEPAPRGAEFAWLQHVVTKLTPKGRAAVIMPSGASFRGGRERRIRQKMVERGVVECVIGLPPGLFRFTGIPTMVWLLRSIDTEPGPADILFIDARELGRLPGRTERRLSVDDTARIAGELRRWRDRGTPGEFTGTPGFSRAVGYDEVSGNDYELTPGRYTGRGLEQVVTAVATRQLALLRRELRTLEERAEKIREVLDTKLDAVIAAQPVGGAGRSLSLGAVCDVLSGPGTVAKEIDDPSGAPLVLPRHIRNNRLEFDDDLATVSPATARRMDREL